MSCTIDAGGRVVIPKAIRDQLGLRAGSEVEVVVRGGTIMVVPVVPAQRLVRKGTALYAEASGPVTELDAATVREVLESSRR